MGEQSISSGTGKPIFNADVKRGLVELKNRKVGAISGPSASYTVSVC